MSGNRSAEKRERSAEKRRAANRSVKSEIRTTLTKSRKAIRAGDPGSPQAVREAGAVLDRAAKKGVIHPNSAARRKSRLMKAFNQSAIQ